MLKRMMSLLLAFALVGGFSAAYAVDETAQENISVAAVETTATPDAASSDAAPSTETTLTSSSSSPAAPDAAADPAQVVPGVESTASYTAVPAPDIATATAALPAETQTLIQNGDFVQAHTELLKLWKETPASALREDIEIVLSDVNSKLLSEQKFPGTVEYRVKSGDSLYVIAKKNKTSVRMIEMINGLKSDVIRPGQKLKVLPGNFSISVTKSNNTLRLYLGGQFFKRYVVATGATSDLTPEGTFTITTKLENPTWFKTGSKAIPPGGPDNLLGTRWLGFSKAGYGIHGTTLPESIGHHSTSGCVRMLNNEVEELYDLVPQGAKVTVLP